MFCWIRDLKPINPATRVRPHRRSGRKSEGAARRAEEGRRSVARSDACKSAVVHELWPPEVDRVAQTLIAEIKCRPDPHTEQNGEEKGIARLHMRCRGRAEVTCNQDRTEEGCPRDDVEQRAHDQHQADPRARICGKAGAKRVFELRIEYEVACDAVHKEKERSECREDVAQPRAACVIRTFGFSLCRSCHLQSPVIWIG